MTANGGTEEGIAMFTGDVAAAIAVLDERVGGLAGFPPDGNSGDTLLSEAFPPPAGTLLQRTQERQAHGVLLGDSAPGAPHQTARRTGQPARSRSCPRVIRVCRHGSASASLAGGCASR